MRKSKLLAVGSMMCASLILATVIKPIESSAASKQTLYVVDSIESSGTREGVVSYQYDDSGLITQAIPNNEPMSTFSYEGGLLTKISDEYSDIASFQYDAKGRMTRKQTYNTDTRYTYNSENQATKSVSKNSYGMKRTTKYSYNDDGNVTKTTENSGNTQTVTTYTYDGKGNFTGSKCETENYKLSYTSKNTYDSKKRLTKRVVKDTYKQKKSVSGIASGRSATNYTQQITYRQIKVPKNR